MINWDNFPLFIKCLNSVLNLFIYTIDKFDVLYINFLYMLNIKDYKYRGMYLYYFFLFLSIRTNLSYTILPIKQQTWKIIIVNAWSS